jgi:hypothetical protein
MLPGAIEIPGEDAAGWRVEGYALLRDAARCDNTRQQNEREQRAAQDRAHGEIPSHLDETRFADATSTKKRFE